MGAKRWGVRWPSWRWELDRRRAGARLMLALPGPDGGWFEVPGVVVRVQEWGFAVRFDRLDPGQQSNLTALLENIAKEAM